MSRSIQETGLADLLPFSLTKDENVSAVFAALDAQLHAVNDCLVPLSIWARLDEQPDEVLDLIGWENAVEGWSDGLPKEEKVRLIRLSTLWKQRKGTLWAIKHLLSFLPFEVEVVTYQHALQRYRNAGGRYLNRTWLLDGSQRLVPWSVTGLPEYTHWAQFCIIATADAEGWKAIKEAVNLAKRATSWPLWIQLKRGEALLDPGPLCLAITHRTGKCRTHSTPVLDGSWVLDGSVQLGERDVEITGELQ